MILNTLSLFILLDCLLPRFFSFSEQRFGANWTAVDSVPTEIFISEKGEDSTDDCGTETHPCKTIGKGMELIEKGLEEETLKIVDSATIPYGFLFSKDFKLTLTTASKQGKRRNITFDLNELTTKGKFHLTNEKTLNMEHLNFNFLIFETKQYLPKDTDEESAVVLSKDVNADLTLRDCSIIINEWIDDYTTFSILRITDGKVLIDELEFLSDNYFLSKANLLHISENVELSKLNGLTIWKMKLDKECALKLPSSFALERSEIKNIERTSDGPALLEACSRAKEKVMITISKSLFYSVKSLESEKGSCFYFEMLHPESILNIFDTVISYGKATKGGGMMIGATKGKVFLESVVFLRCWASEEGGGLLIIDLSQMVGFECTNVSFEECQAKKSGGVQVIFGDEEIKGDAILFKNCLFINNEADIGGKDMTICCEGNADANKAPFDEKCFSTTTKNRVCVMKKEGSEIFHDEWLREDSLELNVDAENGVDSAECGKPEKAPCKMLKQAIVNSLPGKPFSIFTTEKCNKYDTEPIAIEDHHIEIRGKGHCAISLTTVLDETKAQQGEGLFNLKQGGYLELRGAEIKVDTTRKSGRDNGLFVCDGEDAKLLIYYDNVTSTDSNQSLNCVLIECKYGALDISQSIFEHFSSAFALILAVSSKDINIYQIVLDSISTTSDTQSVFTVLSGCQKISCSKGYFSNCNSIEHKIGGALYVEIGDCKSDKSFSDLNFTNCTCKSEQASANKRNFSSNEESKGGAIFIRSTDSAIEQLSIKFELVSFTNCSADKGQYIFISVPIGREQIGDDMFLFEMREIYGKENLILLEERNNGEIKIIDLLSDETNKLSYHSHHIFVGGNKVSNERTCGRKEEPCDSYRTAVLHLTKEVYAEFLTIGRVSIERPLLLEHPSVFSSVPDDYSSLTFSAKYDRGILQIGTKMNAGKFKAVFEPRSYLCLLFIDIEYPDAVEGDALDIIYTKNELKIFDAVFRPWFTGLKGENVLGGDGKMLPYKLIVNDLGTNDVSQLAIYGRNSNVSNENQHRNDLSIKTKKLSSYMIGGLETKAEADNKEIEEENSLCKWNSGLVYLQNSISSGFHDSSFKDISEGALLLEDSKVYLENCSFMGNHPIDEGWEKYLSLRHNIQLTENCDLFQMSIGSLAFGSDGLDGKPFGMLSNVLVNGKTAKNMDSYFFTPVLKNATMIKKAKGKVEEGKGRIIESDEVAQAVIHGSYLFPCGLTVEASQKKAGQELNWVNCPVVEYVSETEMKVNIPQLLLDRDDYTSVIYRVSYPCGVIGGEVKHSESSILINQKKNISESTSVIIYIVIIISSVFAVFFIAIATFICTLSRRKRREYKKIEDLEK
ncbi:uncharacterized protein MONOS_9925 [Monocercomonoides exilis]|uniref:uncharacterized protein n=1 Tax=Monocercomonoides exilis TaxID=2049356 RepID=UPI003559FE35|nr:hypothetical protein MONOS_9925 [Monocercomonoides exilis]|eukprot:MONOS_9925.1-p1 / transcript=MONOS_9925.1 / gene=MONOS_9925 / organism=Monocercomonoides_exilis_PA203 / gene_product=unspecified product / transcript_product=unspecified product / location=Mono_scaffold00428:4643-8698(-) / protein_length=1352 / sequence_SO=supercontig / SO=protein_coding / is_pseudo=false